MGKGRAAAAWTFGTGLTVVAIGATFATVSNEAFDAPNPAVMAGVVIGSLGALACIVGAVIWVRASSRDDDRASGAPVGPDPGLRDKINRARQDVIHRRGRVAQAEADLEHYRGQVQEHYHRSALITTQTELASAEAVLQDLVDRARDA